MNTYLTRVYEGLKKNYPYQKEFLQAVEEIFSSLDQVIGQDPRLEKENLIERFVTPDRIISFRVNWVDDEGKIQVNHGYRVQFNNAIGAYKGGLRFHSSVNESILKFLGLEQVLKNALTGLPLGGAKGGSDFDSHGKSDGEIMRFCQAFMNEFYRYIGEFTDIPAGDIGVGAREIGYLYGQYKRLAVRNDAVFTGKGLTYGGSLIRKQATGYGLCYFASKALQILKGESFKDKKVVISGSGNVAIYAAEKVNVLGGKVIAMSDSQGAIYDENGVDLNAIKIIKEGRRGRIKEYLDEHPSAKFLPTSKQIWSLPCDIALPCATQNELDVDDAITLVNNGVIGVFEGANMPCTIEAQQYFIEKGIIYSPGKASNAGGVAVSGLEMSQNAMRLSWKEEEVDAKLKIIMEDIFNNCFKTSIEYGEKGNLLLGANVYGFKKVAEAMLNQGVC